MSINRVFISNIDDKLNRVVTCIIGESEKIYIYIYWGNVLKYIDVRIPN